MSAGVLLPPNFYADDVEQICRVDGEGIHYVRWRHKTSGAVKRIRVAAKSDDEAKSQSKRNLPGGSDQYEFIDIQRP